MALWRLILSLSDDPWVTEHSPISPEKLHALGYLTYIWNWCEIWIGSIFHVVLGGEPAVAQAVSHDMGDLELFAKIKDVAKIQKN
jgi:hypothetical protein